LRASFSPIVGKFAKLEHSSLPNSQWIHGLLAVHFVAFACKKSDPSFILKPIRAIEDKFQELARGRLIEHHASLKAFGEAISDMEWEIISNEISQITSSRPGKCINVLSSIFEELKTSKTKKVFEDVLNSRTDTKLTDRNLMLATQFFTDDYMVNWLLNSSFEYFLSTRKKLARNITVIDPACGGGNMLVLALEYLDKKYRKSSKSFSLAEAAVENLVGYDVDPLMCELALMNIYLYLESSDERVAIDQLKINCYEDRKYGIFRSDFLLQEPKASRIIITNPPFAGKRDIDSDLRNEMLAEYPEANGDLCISFFKFLLENISQNDLVSIVAQRSWMYLSSFEIFRKELLDDFSVVEIVDLGSNSFRRLSGEKASVALVIAERGANNRKTRVFDLTSTSYSQKVAALESSKKLKSIGNVSLSEFEGRAGNAFLYQVPTSIRKMLRKGTLYSDFATPMQGTSTGDNSLFVDFMWQKSHDSEWRSASKGGSFSRWQGLTYYAVRWGEQGELIKANKGSAIRNLGKMEDTQLVFSDTGTLGLNVRLKIEDQIFIASGPGILAKRGDVFAHLGFLNSTFATYVLRKLNRKLTVAAGYIARLPVTEGVLTDKKVSSLAKALYEEKKNILSKRIIESCYVFEAIPQSGLKKHVEHIATNYFRTEIRIHNSYSNLDKNIYRALALDKMTVEKITLEMGGLNGIKERDANGVDVDLANLLDASVFFTAKSMDNSQLGTDCIYTYLRSIYTEQALAILENAMDSYSFQNQFPLTYNKFLEYALHCVVLSQLGFKNIVEWEEKRCSVDKMVSSMSGMATDFEKTVYEHLQKSLKDWIMENLRPLHYETFKSSPILHITGNEIVLKRKACNE
jgi:hypothetical protein